MGVKQAAEVDRVRQLILTLPLLWLAWGSSLAQTAVRSPFGVPWTATSVLHCKSGQSYRYFVPNTQSFHLWYRGKVRRLMLVTPAPMENWAGPRYSDIAYKYGNPFKLPEVGRGLELMFGINKAINFGRIDLYRIHQSRQERQYVLLDTCWR